MTNSSHPGVRIAATAVPRAGAGQQAAGRPLGLGDLSRVKLPPPLQARLDLASRQAKGSAAWLARARREAFDLLALSVIAPRLSVLDLRLETDLKALLGLIVPVPCKPQGSEEIVLAKRALLGFNWPQRVLTQSLPGWAFMQVLQPREVHLPNVSATPEQGLCLGTMMPVGIRVRELVLAAYSALAGQSIQADEHDPAGVLNVEAARFYQTRPGLTPFSTVPFLGTEDLEELTEHDRLEKSP